MLRKLKLYGELATFVGHKEFDIEVNNVPKAISFLVHNFEGIEQYMNPHYYQVKVGNYEIDKEEIQNPIGEKEDIHIIPVISGSGGVGRAIAGVALIGFSLMMPGGGLFGNTAFGIFGGPVAKAGLYATIGTAASAIGASLVLQGVSEMLFPLPKAPDFSSEEDPRISFNFSGTQNTGRAGTPVPVVYGEIITGSIVISGAIDTEQVQA